MYEHTCLHINIHDSHTLYFKSEHVENTMVGVLRTDKLCGERYIVNWYADATFSKISIQTLPKTLGC
jgi:hypothetical protein